LKVQSCFFKRAKHDLFIGKGKLVLQGHTLEGYNVPLVLGIQVWV